MLRKQAMAAWQIVIVGRLVSLPMVPQIPTCGLGLFIKGPYADPVHIITEYSLRSTLHAMLVTLYT
jgi:hypothetical protein